MLCISFLCIAKRAFWIANCDAIPLISSLATFDPAIVDHGNQRKELTAIHPYLIEDKIAGFQKMVGYLNGGYSSITMNMILSMSRWEIWKIRCINKYENKYLDEKCLICVISKGIIEHMYKH